MGSVNIVTPLRDEINNIPNLFKSVSSQNVHIQFWVIVENGSTDGSKEYLREVEKPSNVENLIVLNEDIGDQRYALGNKYASIVNRGFQEILQRSSLGPNDLIGILDADSFPKPGYYSKLIAAFEKDADLGISSGISVDELTLKRSGHAKDWVRGSCRLWRFACFDQSGYIIGPSADTLSLARAEIDGWSAYVVPEAEFVAREVGTRSKQKYYGSSAYYRGNTPFYAALRALKFASKLKFAAASDYVTGYFSAYLDKAERIEDEEIRDYFKSYVSRKLRRRIQDRNRCRA